MSQRRLGGETLYLAEEILGGGICGTDFFREGVIVFGPGVFIGAISCRLVPRKESHPFFEFFDCFHAQGIQVAFLNRFVYSKFLKVLLLD